MGGTDSRALQAAWRRAHRQPPAATSGAAAEPLPEQREARLALALQAGHDTDCADALRLRLALRSWARQYAGRDSGRRPAVGFWLTAAAGLLLASWLGWQLRPPPTLVYRGDALVADLQAAGDSVLQDAPAVLRWPWPEGAERVQLHLFDSDVQLLWQSDWLVRAETSLPQQVRQHMRLGGTFYWRLREAAPGRQGWGRLHRIRIEFAGGAGDQP